MQIDLIYLTTHPQDGAEWDMGDVLPVKPDPAAIAELCRQLTREKRTEFFLFWDKVLPLPEKRLVTEISASPGDVWHGGLRLGQGGRPRLLDFVNPVWRFNRDPNLNRRATSWRLSLHACLVKASVLRRLGGPAPAFDTLSGTALELGHRWIVHGAFVQHEPALLATASLLTSPPPSLADEFYFIRRGYGDLWVLWALGRALASGYGAASTARACWKALRRPVMAVSDGRWAGPPQGDDPKSTTGKLSVSVLIPTLDRYPHLFQLLDQLRIQTLQPLEVIVVDQTPLLRRRPGWPEKFSDIPLRVIWRNQAGQCSSRNAGLREASGDTVLFLDDDDEIPADLVERHLTFVTRRGLDASCGVVEEMGAGVLPAAFRRPRVSDVFPAGNTLLKRDALSDSGLFDLAYERGERADGDLGMRLYLAGKALGLNPDAAVVHLRAPRGGLRQHQARAVTRGGSRATLRQRHLLAPTEGYLWSRYFTARQVREALIIRTLSTLRGRGKFPLRILRMLLMTLLLLDTYLRNRARLREGKGMLAIHPTIPSLEEDNCQGPYASIDDSIK